VAAVRVSERPLIDGRLDDPAWKLAPAGGPLIQVTPIEGAEPSEDTEFRIVYDDDALYIGIWCFDREPREIIGREMARDGRITSDDYVTIVLDTFLDRRNGYQFRVNPAGARGDALITNNVDLNESWNGIWSAAAALDGEGWKAEIEIPFKSLSFDPHASTWGFNLERYIKRHAERCRWSGARQHLRLYNVAEAGLLTGLEGMRHGLGLEVTPYGIGKLTRLRVTEETHSSASGGLDLRYSITPNLALRMSYNMDFAETEVDQRQVNLTRFPLFFPEKRAFFLEDSGIFRFGGLGSELIPFFSRRIGLSQGGQVVPITVAGKLSGRINSYNIGFIDALLDDHDGRGMENVLVARVSKNVFDQSSAGLILTHGDPDSDAENVLGGADFAFRTSELLGDNILQGNLFTLGTYSEAEGGRDGFSFGGSLDFPNEPYLARLQVLQIGEDFNPALGFVPRRGVRAYSSSASYRPRPLSVELIRQLYFIYSNSHVTDLSDRLDTASHSFYPLYVLFESGDEVFFSTTYQLDAPAEAFEISRGVVIPAGDYWWDSYRLGFDTASKRPIELDAGYSFGNFYGGERSSVSWGVDLKPLRHIVFRLGYSLNQVRLPQGDFETRLGSARMQLSFTPDLIWTHLVQYDNVSDTLGYYSRIHWEVVPGTNVYAVLNQTIDRSGGRLRWLDSELTAKAGVTFRF
jgi:hypothetical protein